VGKGERRRGRDEIGRKRGDKLRREKAKKSERDTQRHAKPRQP
jgi:hypothetical protein